jgi:retinol-binding protein 3
MRISLCQCVFALLTMTLVGQQPPADIHVDEAERNAIVDSLVSKIQGGYIVPEGAQVAVQKLRSAQASGAYKGLDTAKTFAEKLTSDLRSATHDKHIAVFVDPEASTPTQSAALEAKPREHFNFGFYKIERLEGNVGYLDLRSFANLDEGRQTASTYLDALANFDAIIIDLRQNGGGNTPMVAYIASYLFDPKPVHFTDMYWRDQNQTVQLWTEANVPGRRSVSQDVYILVGPSTFSAAEDFCYSLKQLKRATLVGERTGGGAHMGRGLQRLSPLFTAFIPTGQSLNPLTKTNWENVGVEPDVNVPAEKALAKAHALALGRLLEHVSDPKWKSDLRRAIEDIGAGKTDSY